MRNFLLKKFFGLRLRSLDHMRRHPLEVQAETLRTRLAEGAKTAFGQAYLKNGLESVPLQDYESFKPYIERMLAGEKDVACRGKVRLFARSSGTTSDRSKYIPVSERSLWENHTRGMRDVGAVYTASHPATKIFAGKTLTLGGSSLQTETGATVGDLSALLIGRTGRWSGWFRAPRMSTALIPDFDQKIEAICKECSRENITAFAGVPSWNLLLMRRMLEYTGKKTLTDIWPSLELFVHGGVSFSPYRRSFEALVPSGLRCLETYNASEGFFALADDPLRDDMLLMLDYGTYYEFRQGTTIVPLEGVRTGQTYALIVTSSNGLWRYEIGDTVTFTSIDPYRIKFAGRTTQFINAFGEEVVVANAEAALEAACEATGAVVEEYSVAPFYMDIDRSGAHEWVVEFSVSPASLEKFRDVLDATLRAVNSDYDAKRASTLAPPRLHILEKGATAKWLRARGKNKLPRMQNDRKLIEQLLCISQ